jgi:hypothetical protein
LVEVASFTVDGGLFKSLVNAMLVVDADFIQFTRRALRVVSMDPSRVMLLNVSLSPADYRCDVDSLWVETSSAELERVARKIKAKDVVRVAVVDDKFNVGSFEKVGWVIKEEDVLSDLKTAMANLESLQKPYVEAKLRVVLPTFRRIVKSAEATKLAGRWRERFEHVGLRVEDREGNVVFFSDRETYSRVDIKGFVDWVLEIDGRTKVLYNLERFSSLLLLGLGEVATLEVRTGGVLRVGYAGNFWTVDFWLAPTVSEEMMGDFEAILTVAKPTRKLVWRLTFGESVKDFVKVLRAVSPTVLMDTVTMGGIGDEWWVYWKDGSAGFIKMDRHSFDEFVSFPQTAFGEFSLTDLIGFLKDADKVECFLEGEPTASLVLVASGAKIPTKEHKSQKLAEAVAVPEVKGTTLFSGSTETLTSICDDAITAKDEFLIFISKPFEITVLGRNKIYYEATLPVDSFKTVEEDYVATRAIEGLRTFFANIPADISFVGKEGYNIILEAQPRIAHVKTELFQDAEGLKEALDFYEQYRRAPAPPKPTEIKPLVEAPPTAIREPTEQEVLGLFMMGVMWTEEYFFNEAKRRGWNLPKASEILAKLEREGVIYEPSPGFYKRTEVAPPPPALPTVRAYWGTSPRGLPALWVEVYVEGKLKVRGHLEVRRETREILERIINEKIKDSVVDAGLPEDILLVDPLLKVTTDLVKTLLETAPPEVLAPPKPLEVRWKPVSCPAGVVCEVTEMSPSEFLSKVPSPCREGATALHDIHATDCWSQSSIDAIMEKVKRGEELDPPMLDYTQMFRGFPSHEGRHTAFVAHKLGVAKMPVIIFGTTPMFETIMSDYSHDQLVAEGWKPTIVIPRLEEALKAPGTGGHSTPELALEATKKQYSPEFYDFKVVKHYALHSEFPYTVFVREKKLLPKVEKPVVKSYAELEAEFKGKDAVDALASYVTNYYGLRRDYLLEDLNTYLRSLKTRLTDEDLQRFYRVYPSLKESFVAIASLISWIPPPPKDLEKIAEEALRELGGL